MKDLFYVVGIIAGIILGAWGLINTYRLSKKTTFINTVTSERTKWIAFLRKNIADFCALALHWALTKGSLDANKQQEIREESDRLRMLIRLQLNPHEDYSKKITILLDEILSRTDPSAKEPGKLDVLKSKLNELIEITQVLLKDEWEKVKAEAKKGDLKE